MANYKKHTAFNLFIALPLLVAAIFYIFHPPRLLMGIFLGTFIYCTLFMSPDLDYANKVKLFSLRGIMTLPFRGYALLFKHRGISHSPIFGSLTRILWLTGIVLLFFYAVYATLPSEKNLLGFFFSYRPLILYGLAAICFADWCHLLMDAKKH